MLKAKLANLNEKDLSKVRSRKRVQISHFLNVLFCFVFVFIVARLGGRHAMEKKNETCQFKCVKTEYRFEYQTFS